MEITPDIMLQQLILATMSHPTQKFLLRRPTIIIRMGVLIPK